MLLCCITLSSSRENQRSAEEVARRISGAVAGEIYAKSRHTKYPSQLLPFALHYLPFASRFPLPHFTIAIFFALFFHPPSLFQFASFACFLFACVLDCLLITMAQDNTKLCDFANINNNDFFALQLLLLPVLNLVKLMLPC